jgi:hypothetical protein
MNDSVNTLQDRFPGNDIGKIGDVDKLSYGFKGSIAFMIFNSFAFLFGFLPLAIVIYIAASRYEPLRLPVLFALSIVFYGWWNPIFIPLILCSILANWKLKLLSRVVIPGILPDL